MECPTFEKYPLGKDCKIVRVSKEEMHLAWKHREATGEPIQSWVRRKIRENWGRDGHSETGTNSVLPVPQY